MNSSKLAIFDMDGTVIDSMPVLTDIAVFHLSAHYKLRAGQAVQAYENTTGAPFREQLELLFPGDSRNDDVAASYGWYHRLFAPTFPLAAGAIAVSRLLKQLDWYLALVSSTSVEIVHKMPQLSELSFNFTQGYTPGSPKELQIKRACEFLETDEKDVIYYGDARADSDYAARANVKFVRIWPGKLLITVMAATHEYSQRSLAAV